MFLPACSDAQRLARKKGLPTNYKFEQKILKTAERDRLDAKACPDCQKVRAGDYCGWLVLMSVVYDAVVRKWRCEG